MNYIYRNHFQDKVPEISCPYAMKIYGGVRYRSPFSVSALDGGKWPASRSGHFTSEEIAPDTHWIGALLLIMAERSTAGADSFLIYPQSVIRLTL
jgi:hypothetical protein